MAVLLAGELRHVISIVVPTVASQGDRGQDVPGTPTTIGPLQARIEPLSGRQQEISRQLVPSATHKITIRYQAGVIPLSTVTFGARTFNVGAVRNIMETKFAMELIVTEVQ
jgi:SPP1 family predicted phage head-tail adaptor